MIPFDVAQLAIEAAQFSFSMNNIMDCVPEMFFGLNM